LSALPQKMAVSYAGFTVFVLEHSKGYKNTPAFVMPAVCSHSLGARPTKVIAMQVLQLLWK